MYLGLINGRFVPLNLIEAQNSPVLLQNFQLAPQT